MEDLPVSVAAVLVAEAWLFHTATRLFPRRSSSPPTMGLARTYSIVVEEEEAGGYFVTVPALPGCCTRGKTVEECRVRAIGGDRSHIAGLRADGEPVPEELEPPRLLAVTVAA